MRGLRRSARGESSRKVGREFEPFTISGRVSHLTKTRSEPCHRTRGAASAARRRPFSTFELLSARESGRSGCAGFSSADRAYVGSKHIPAKGPWSVDDMDSEAYVSQFSADGSLLIAGFRGSRIRIYDAEKGWKVRKDISCRSLRWTVSDIALSPDQRFLAYSSLSPIVHIVNVQSAGKESHANITEIHEGLDFFADEHDDDLVDFGIFSVKFSKDGREIVVGNNEKSIYVYDLGANKVSVRIHAHTSDVNAVTFADESGNVLYSGSDDSLCKVWDRRCLVGGKSAGVLTGHLDGVTFIDSRGDGRYFISNCKDQTIKLWDIRKMSSVTRACPLRMVDWDYRWMSFPAEAHHFRHPDDKSLATYRGHSVLRTLIRCYFSPMHSTGQRYIYTGSSDKSVYIYDVVTGTTVERLSWHGSIIRDCTWHPHYPTLVSSSWDGYLARWEASGDDDDPSMLASKEQRRSPFHMYGDPFLL
ncbi:LEC14B homolog [Phragmites australis]|uniref:LEC14B homolog n=1 Tax=Phragmites australis TaxID=29695 RepID=UPI002D79C5DA|nr:LEC14B homolog [Phragmites australis]XP_062180334.1 LEC14B homolog [Phragmites australis]XP_062180335.1 LEC14B homolog [Phragmites australis]